VSREGAGLVIPGEQECLTCGFGLSKRILRTTDGAVGIQADAPLEVCPNGCGALVGVTWERGFRQMVAAAEDLAAQRNGIISRLRARWPHIEIPAPAHLQAEGVRRVDPGPGTCLRCAIEDAIGEPLHDGLGPPRGAVSP